MFNGAAKYGPKQFDRVLESRGGYSNAYTSNDLTVYYEDFASEALETVVDLESDRMRSLRIDDEALAQEREVVKEERRLRTDNSIFGLHGGAARGARLPRPPLPLAGHRLDGGHRADQPGRLRGLLPDLLRPLQRGHLRGGRPRSRRDAGAAGARSTATSRPARLRRRWRRASRAQRGERRAPIRFPAQAPALLVGWRGPAGRSPDAPRSTCCRSASRSASPRACGGGWCSEEELAVSVTHQLGLADRSRESSSPSSS